MLARTRAKGPLVVLDVRGWLSPSAAWEVGIASEQLVVARCADPVRWARTAAALLDGVGALYAEVPPGIKEAQLRKLSALVRSRKTPVVLRPVSGELPGGVAHLKLSAREVQWEGTNRGHGRLGIRRLVFEATGKTVRGMTRLVEMEDDGAAAVRVVSGLAIASTRRAAG